MHEGHKGQIKVRREQILKGQAFQIDIPDALEIKVESNRIRPVKRDAVSASPHLAISLVRGDNRPV